MTIAYSVVIVNYHSISEITACLRSLADVHPAADYEVIIVSNSEVSESEKRSINAIYSGCLWIEMEHNVGYGQACNAGADKCTGDYIFFLNPDTTFLNDALAILKRSVDSYDQKTAAGPATFTSDLERIPSIKNTITFSWMMQWLCPSFRILSNKSGAYDPRLYEETTEVDIINGSAIFMHKSAYHSTGGFSDDYFMYWEENDFCLSLKNHGYHVLYTPDAQIVHDSGHSTKKVFLPMEIEKHRSQKVFMNKHHPYLARINRLFGVIAYSWRLAGSLLLFRPDKTKQFRTLFTWYLVRYK